MSTKGEEILLFQLTVFNREYRAAMPPIVPRTAYRYMCTNIVNTYDALINGEMYVFLPDHSTHICPQAALILIHLILHSKRHLA